MRRPFVDIENGRLCLFILGFMFEGGLIQSSTTIKTNPTTDLFYTYVCMYNMYIPVFFFINPHTCPALPCPIFTCFMILTDTIHTTKHCSRLCHVSIRKYCMPLIKLKWGSNKLLLSVRILFRDIFNLFISILFLDTRTIVCL